MVTRSQSVCDTMSEKAGTGQPSRSVFHNKKAGGIRNIFHAMKSGCRKRIVSPKSDSAAGPVAPSEKCHLLFRSEAQWLLVNDL